MNGRIMENLHALPLATLASAFVGSHLASYLKKKGEIRERQPEGIAIAKREGKYGGRKPSLNADSDTELRRTVAAGDSKAALAREFGISRDTLYRYAPVKRTGKLR